MEEKLREIMEKLGFDPRTYKPYIVPAEDDRFDNPFSKLTTEEIDFLADNKLLGSGI